MIWHLANMRLMEVQKKKLILSSWSLDSHPTREEGNIALPQSWTKDFVQDYFRFGKVMDTLLYLKWITNKILLYSTWNSAQWYVPAWMGGRFGGRMLLLFRHSVVSDSLWPHGLQHVRLYCPWLSCPLNWWCGIFCLGLFWFFSYSSMVPPNSFAYFTMEKIQEGPEWWRVKTWVWDSSHSGQSLQKEKWIEWGKWKTWRPDH